MQGVSISYGSISEHRNRLRREETLCTSALDMTKRRIEVLAQSALWDCALWDCVRLSILDPHLDPYLDSNLEV